MKRTLLFLGALAFTGHAAFAQDNGENNLKNFRFGLKVAPMMTWYKPDASSKNFIKNGASLKLSYGLITEFRLNKVASFCTGIEVAYDGGKLAVGATTPNYYYTSKDGNLISTKDTSSQQHTPFELFSRSYKTTYLTLPVTLKLKTDQIGSMTYYGQFGVNCSFRLKSHVNDDVIQGTNIPGSTGFVINPNSPHTTQTALDNTGDMNLFKFTLNLGAGAEWNLSGSTSMTFGINYYQGFSNVLKSDSKYIFTGDSSSGYGAVKQNAKCSGIALTIGFLF